MLVFVCPLICCMVATTQRNMKLFEQNELEEQTVLIIVKFVMSVTNFLSFSMFLTQIYFELWVGAYFITDK